MWTCLFLALLTISVTAESRLEINENLWLSAELIENVTIRFTAHFPTGNWFGIGFNNHDMFGTPMFILEESDTPEKVPTVSQRYSAKHGPPVPYEDSLYTNLTYTPTPDYWELTFERPLNITQRDNETDVIELDKKIIGIWAHKEGALSRHARQNRGVYTMFIHSDTGMVVFNEKESGTDTFYKIHGIIMYITWSILSFVAITSARYMKHLYKYKLIIHAASGTLIATNTMIIVWLALGTYKVKGSHLDYGHSAIGIIVLVLVILQFIGGMFVRQSHTVLRWQSKLAAFSKMGHRLSGFLLVLIANYQVVGGLYNYDSPVKGLIFLHFAIYVLMLVGMEILYRVRFKNKDKGVMDMEDAPEISLDEFNQFIRNGRKLVLFNNFVIDVETFMSEHPGTRFVIAENIGNDIGKYFYGAYAVEADVAPHIHSNYAAALMKKLTVGKLKTSQMRSSINAEYSGSMDKESFRAMTGDNLVFTVRTKEQLTPSVSRITFHCMDCNVEKIYPGLKLAGRSFSVTSLQNYVSRYYTLCNCMGSLICDEYKKVISACLEDQPYSRNYSSYQEFNSKANDCLELIIKLYPQSQTGISRQVFEATPGDQFYIHGPVGRGLELNKSNSTGINLLFVGGTGILPFMDLFAYILRKLLAENDPNYEMFPGEKFNDLAPNAQFIIYAYFPDRSQCLGMDFVEDIVKLHQKYGKSELFRLNLILTKEGDQKFNNDELVELLTDYKHSYGRVNKLWVCGPPPMNQQFHKLNREIRESTGLDFEDFVIL